MQVNDGRILTVSSYDYNHNICISIPVIVNKTGVREKLFIPLIKEEQEKLINSINIIKDAIKKL